MPLCKYSTKSHDAANECVLTFNCSLPHLRYKRNAKFLKYSENILCNFSEKEHEGV